MTVRNAVYGIQQKLGVTSMQGLVLWAARNGLLDDYDPAKLSRRPATHRCAGGEMAEGARGSGGIHPVTTTASVFGIDGLGGTGDLDGLRLIAKTSVWARWFIFAFGFASGCTDQRTGPRPLRC